MAGARWKTLDPSHPLPHPWGCHLLLRLIEDAQYTAVLSDTVYGGPLSEAFRSTAFGP